MVTDKDGYDGWITEFRWKIKKFVLVWWQMKTM